MVDVVLWTRSPPRQRSRSGLERPAIEGESPVGVSWKELDRDSRVPYPDLGAGIWEPPTSKTKYVSRPIAH